MEQQFDAQAMMARVSEVAKELRKSEAYPAIIGGVAGGIAGALMAVMIARVVSSRCTSAPASETVAAKASGRPPFSVRDLVQLVTVVATLAKQVQEWSKEQGKK